MLSGPITADAIARRIVVLDSNPVLISIVGVLRMAGHCVFQAYDGDAALELCDQLPRIDLLILNTHVDGLSAHDLISATRSRQPGIPILHIDSHRAPGIPEAVPTLTEPFTAEQLLSMVAELTGDHSPEALRALIVHPDERRLHLMAPDSRTAR